MRSGRGNRRGAESLTGTYEYLANNVTNDFITSMLQGNIDMNVPGDEQYGNSSMTKNRFFAGGCNDGVCLPERNAHALTTSDG